MKNNKDFKILNAYINKNLVKTEDYDFALEELSQLVNAIDESKLFFPRFILYDLVNDNIILNNILKVIVTNIDDFDNLEGLFDSETAILFIEAYAMQNEIIPVSLEEFAEVNNNMKPMKH